MFYMIKYKLSNGPKLFNRFSQPYKNVTTLYRDTAIYVTHMFRRIVMKRNTRPRNLDLEKKTS